MFEKILNVKTLKFIACPNNTKSSGPCINDICPVGYQCTTNMCCPSETTTPFTIDASTLSINVNATIPPTNIDVSTPS